MKRVTSLVVIGACLLSPEKATAAAVPVGFDFLKAQPGVFSLLGLRVHSISEVAGDIDVSGSTLFDPDTNFDTVLDPPPAKYQIELEGGTSDGKVLEIVSFAENTLIVSEPLPAETNVSYLIRKVPKLSDVIDPMEPLATADFNPDHADLILLPTGNGQFTQYFVSTYMDAGHPEYFQTYINADTGLPEDPFLSSTDGFFYLRRDLTDFEGSYLGEVKVTNTHLAVTDSFNYFSSVYPVNTFGLKLSESGLAASLQPGTAETADLIWSQDASGNYHTYFYSDGTPPLTTGWRKANAAPGTEDDDQSNAELNSGFIIHRRAPAPYPALLTPPPI